MSLVWLTSFQITRSLNLKDGDVVQHWRKTLDSCEQQTFVSGSNRQIHISSLGDCNRERELECRQMAWNQCSGAAESLQSCSPSMYAQPCILSQAHDLGCLAFGSTYHNMLQLSQHRFKLRIKRISRFWQAYLIWILCSTVRRLTAAHHLHADICEELSGTFTGIGCHPGSQPIPTTRFDKVHLYA